MGFESQFHYATVSVQASDLTFFDSSRRTITKSIRLNLPFGGGLRCQLCRDPQRESRLGGIRALISYFDGGVKASR